ncbi:MAG: glycosyltransferase [Shinella sp.]|nr:glycosyltransferase [Shinella sp.]
MRELVKNGKHDYRFWGGVEAVEGIEPFTGDALVQVNPLRFVQKGRRSRLKGFWPAVVDRSVDVVIILGNANVAATWAMALAARLLGKKVLFWAHGWRRREALPKRVMRNLYHRLAHRILVYGERARSLGAESGYPRNRIRVIYNSLDFEGAEAAVAKIEAGGLSAGDRPRALFARPDRPLVVCTARLTALCRFDLLLRAAVQLAARRLPVNVLLVGDGPERGRLEALARELDLDVHFHGACHDEEELAPMIYHADLTVSPGKVGLTAIHSLIYGTPVVTHGDFDRQMPEVEAITPGSTGSFFRAGDVDNLANAIGEWLLSGRDREEVRRLCRQEVAARWTPCRQRELIDAAVDELFQGEAA